MVYNFLVFFRVVNFVRLRRSCSFKFSVFISTYSCAFRRASFVLNLWSKFPMVVICQSWQCDLHILVLFWLFARRFVSFPIFKFLRSFSFNLHYFLFSSLEIVTAFFTIFWSGSWREHFCKACSAMLRNFRRIFWFFFFFFEKLYCVRAISLTAYKVLMHIKLSFI